jgi:hypothetical protein
MKHKTKYKKYAITNDLMCKVKKLNISNDRDSKINKSMSVKDRLEKIERIKRQYGSESNQYITIALNEIIDILKEYFDVDEKIIAYQPKGNTPELFHTVKLPLLPEMVVEDDVEKLCWRLFGGSFEARGVESEVEADRTVSFGIECYNAATKVYTEADLRKAFEKGFTVATYLADYETEITINNPFKSKVDIESEALYQEWLLERKEQSVTNLK